MSTYSYVPLLQQGTGMTANKTGGPAFPNAAFGSSRNEQQGMTLRDYFAAKAMQGLIERRGGAELGSREKDEVAEEAYILADAMLKARAA